MSESKVAVAVRIRPLLGKEKVERCTTCVEVLSETQVLMGGDKQFTFDFVFSPEEDQSSVYSCVSPLVENFFNGYNATVLAYGQTGSGKTFTMGSGCGGTDEGGLNLDLGVIPRATSQIFELISQKRAALPTTEFYLRVQFLELYGETLRDLLDPVGTAQGKQVSIRDGPNDTLQIVGATEDAVKSPGDMLALLDRGTLCRTTGSTDMNSHSSRSHAIFTIILEQHLKPISDPTYSNVEEETEYRIAKFHFVDLAGSERAKRTRASGQRLREGININMGLLALGNVISALGAEEASSMNRFVPYRDSKLTRMLQDSLGGNSRTLMIACISPADINFEETLNALRYANRARNIKNRAIINRDPKASQIAALKAQIAELKLQIVNNIGSGTNSAGHKKDQQEDMAIKHFSTGNYSNEKNNFLELEVSRLSELLEREKQSKKELHDRYMVLEAERVALLGAESIDEVDDEDELEEINDEDQTQISKIVGGDEEDEDLELQQRYEKSQKYLRKIVHKYDESLRLKQEAMDQIVSERTKFETLKAHFESKMAEMNEEVKDTQMQRDTLEHKLRDLESMEHSKQTDVSKSEAQKLRMQMADKDKKLRELEERTRQLYEARKQAAEWQKKESLVRLEIEHFKREKVEYQRRIAENQKRHIEELKDRRLEIAGLKRERDRLEQDTNHLTARTERDFKLIQQKSEQVAAMQRKLREAQRLTFHPQALSDREKKQRLEIERLAALQVKREEELLDLRRALAKKEDAIGRRDRLLEQLEKIRKSQDSSLAQMTIQELVPNATEEDVKELELRLETANTEIIFRDKKCREVLEREDGTTAEQITLSFSSLDQAKEVCQVLMQMFVESKKELRERKEELASVQAQFVHQDQKVKIDRRRTETLLAGGGQAAASPPPVSAYSISSSLNIVNPKSPILFPSLSQQTPERSNKNREIFDSEVRIKEAKLRSLQVEDQSPSRSVLVPPLPQVVTTTMANRRLSRSWENVVNRLTSPSNATGIHKYGRKLPIPPLTHEELGEERKSLPRRRTLGVAGNGIMVEEDPDIKFPSLPSPRFSMASQSYMRMTESQLNKQQMDAEARKINFNRSRVSPPRGPRPLMSLPPLPPLLTGTSVPGKENFSLLHRTLADERKRRRNQKPTEL